MAEKAEVIEKMKGRRIRPLFKVSRREKQVLLLVCHGAPNKIIASKLGISEQTVKNHVSNLMFNSGARSRTELTYWTLAGIIRPESEE